MELHCLRLMILLYVRETKIDVYNLKSSDNSETLIPLWSDLKITNFKDLKDRYGVPARD